jgi:thiazole synthase ThiGH ThiG subunit
VTAPNTNPILFISLDKPRESDFLIPENVKTMHVLKLLIWDNFQIVSYVNLNS